jgi:hypothetical protein
VVEFGLWEKSRGRGERMALTSRKNSMAVPDVSTIILVSGRMDLQGVERLQVTRTKNKKAKSKAAPFGEAKPKGCATPS